jgi:peptidoglycan hydrolase CwlO-like protein
MKEEKDNKPSILSIIALVVAIISLIWSLTNAKFNSDLLDTQVQVVQTLDKQNKKLNKELVDLADCVSDTVKNLPYTAEVTVRGDTYKVELYTLNNKKETKNAAAD